MERQGETNDKQLLLLLLHRRLLKLMLRHFYCEKSLSNGLKIIKNLLAAISDGRAAAFLAAIDSMSIDSGFGGILWAGFATELWQRRRQQQQQHRRH